MGGETTNIRVPSGNPAPTTVDGTHRGASPPSGSSAVNQTPAVGQTFEKANTRRYKLTGANDPGKSKESEALATPMPTKKSRQAYIRWIRSVMERVRQNEGPRQSRDQLNGFFENIKEQGGPVTNIFAAIFGVTGDKFYEDALGIRNMDPSRPVAGSFYEVDENDVSMRRIAKEAFPGVPKDQLHFYSRALVMLNARLEAMDEVCRRVKSGELPNPDEEGLAPGEAEARRATVENFRRQRINQNRLMLSAYPTAFGTVVIPDKVIMDEVVEFFTGDAAVVEPKILGAGFPRLRKLFSYAEKEPAELVEIRRGILARFETAKAKSKTMAVTYGIMDGKVRNPLAIAAAMSFEFNSDAPLPEAPTPKTSTQGGKPPAHEAAPVAGSSTPATNCASHESGPAPEGKRATVDPAQVEQFIAVFRGAAQAGQGETYVVKKGDRLRTIWAAHAKGKGISWEEFCKHNGFDPARQGGGHETSRGKRGSWDPDLINQGEKLRIPSPTSSQHTHVEDIELSGRELDSIMSFLRSQGMAGECGLPPVGMDLEDGREEEESASGTATEEAAASVGLAGQTASQDASAETQLNQQKRDDRRRSARDAAAIDAAADERKEELEARLVEQNRQEATLDPETGLPELDGGAGPYPSSSLS